LRAEHGRLAEIRTDDRSLATTFATSYRRLDHASQHMFRLLGVTSGRDIDANAAAALAGVPVEEAELIMEHLLDQHLVMQPRHDQYRMPDLLRLYARQEAAREQPVAQRQAALAGLTALAGGGITQSVARTA
jgi:hypothetical protein